MSDLVPLLLVCVAAFVAGLVNAIAGGGTFLSFPALTGIAQLSEKAANMTSTIGLWPGSAASVLAAKKEFHYLSRRMVLTYSAISLVGGTLGSVLLRVTSPESFALVIPWLLLFATVIFALGKRISRWAKQHQQQAEAERPPHAPSPHGMPAGVAAATATTTGATRGATPTPAAARHAPAWAAFVALVQFAVAVYGGYFGAGIGVLMLAGLSFAGLENLHQLNALKVLLATLINGAAALIFLFDPAVQWGTAGAMAVASIVGGFLGMDLARRVPEKALRATILVVGAALTGYYFWQNYLVHPAWRA